MPDPYGSFLVCRVGDGVVQGVGSLKGEGVLERGRGGGWALRRGRG